MATYTIQINERKKEGKVLLDYLNNLGVVVQPKGGDLTLKAIQELREGKVTRCSTMAEYKKAVR